MANIFRKTYTEYWVHRVHLDGNNQPCEQDAPGARFVEQRRVKPGTTGAEKVTRKGKKWYGYVPGSSAAVPLCSNKAAATVMYAEMVKKSELGQAGVVDRFEKHRKKPLTKHLADYEAFIRAEGNCKEYVRQTKSRIQVVINGCQFDFIEDLASEKVSTFLETLRRDPVKPELPLGQEVFTPAEMVAALGGRRPGHLARLLRREGLPVIGGNDISRRYPRATVEALQDLVLCGVGIATSNGYLVAMKGFTKWLADKKRTDHDHLISLGTLNAKTDTRHERRALEETEMQLLLAETQRSQRTLEGLTGPDRQMVYALAMTTGLRAKELATLIPLRFQLDGPTPAVVVKAAYAKNRKEAAQPLSPDVAAAMRVYLEGKDPAAILWPGEWFSDAAEMLRADLEAAGIIYRDQEGKVCDFHALRHSYASLLARNGVHPKIAQELCRHSDIRLTMQIYSHVRPADVNRAVESLPPLLPSVCMPVCRNFDRERQDMTTNDEMSTDEAECGIGSKRPENAEKEDEREGKTKDDENYPAWIRTRTKRAKISSRESANSNSNNGLGQIETRCVGGCADNFILKFTTDTDKRLAVTVPYWESLPEEVRAVFRQRAAEGVRGGCRKRKQS